MKKGITLFLAVVLALSVFSGCSRSSARDERQTVTVALWSDQLTERYAQYLQENFPDVDFEFYVATNSTDFYQFKQERGDLPDILTVRRFALRDVADWKDSLMDLGGTELAGTFPQTYLRSYTYSDGSLNWLPACGEIDGILVNEDLLKEHNIPLPANYGEFVDACGQLSALGIRPFRSNFAADYTCMEILQGLSVQCLTSQTGREWRQMYESGQTDQLSEEVWLPVFQRMQEFIDYAGVGPNDLEGNTADMFRSYASGETAMIRGTSGEASNYSVEGSTAILPYFGETEEDNWYLTYPSFQVAARAEEDPERRALILSIMEVMLNEEGLRHIATGQDMVAYNKDVELELSPSLSRLPSYMERNHLYIRLASSDMFSVSRQVVQGMISGEYADARSAYRAFNERMNDNGTDAAIAAHLETGYSYAFDSHGGSPAASAVMNTLREEMGTRLLVGQSICVAGDIAAGDYTGEELRFLTMGESPVILKCDITGEQLFRYLEYVLQAPNRRGSVINDSTLYVASGFEMKVKRTEEGYLLEELTIDGQKMDRQEVYSVALLGSGAVMMQDALEAAGISNHTDTGETYEQVIVDRLAGGGQLAAPEDYIILH